MPKDVQVFGMIDEVLMIKYANELDKMFLLSIQESVFEGELSSKQCTDLNKELNDIIKDDDEVIMYYTYSNKQLNRMVNGKKKNFNKNILI